MDLTLFLTDKGPSCLLMSGPSEAIPEDVHSLSVFSYFLAAVSELQKATTKMETVEALLNVCVM